MKKILDIKYTKFPNTKILLAGLLFTIVILGILIKAGENFANKQNKVEKTVAEEEVFKGVKFSNIKMEFKNGITVFTADLTNITKKEIKEENYYIDLFDKKGNLVITLLACVPGGLKPNETKDIIASATGSLKKAVTKEIRLEKAK